METSHSVKIGLAYYRELQPFTEHDLRIVTFSFISVSLSLLGMLMVGEEK